MHHPIFCMWQNYAYQISSSAKTDSETEEFIASCKSQTSTHLVEGTNDRKMKTNQRQKVWMSFILTWFILGSTQFSSPEAGGVTTTNVRPPAHAIDSQFGRPQQGILIVNGRQYVVDVSKFFAKSQTSPPSIITPLVNGAPSITHGTHGNGNGRQPPVTNGHITPTQSPPTWYPPGFKPKPAPGQTYWPSRPAPNGGGFIWPPGVLPPTQLQPGVSGKQCQTVPQNGGGQIIPGGGGGGGGGGGQILPPPGWPSGKFQPQPQQPQRPIYPAQPQIPGAMKPKPGVTGQTLLTHGNGGHIYGGQSFPGVGHGIQPGQKVTHHYPTHQNGQTPYYPNYYKPK